MCIYEAHSMKKGILKKSKIHFFRPLHECKLCILWNWLIAEIILISQNYLF